MRRLGLLLLLLLAAASARAAELTFQRIIVPSGSVAPVRAVLSPDGRHLYGVNATPSMSGIAVYERDRTTGSLGFVEEYVQGPGALVDLLWPLQVLVTADGAFVLVAVERAIYVFRRDAVDGTLTFVEAEKEGFAPDPFVPTPAIALSPDGLTVYAGTQSGRVLVFSRNASTGALTFVEAEDDSAGGARHFADVDSLVVSPDGEFVYAASSEEDAITLFERNSITGAIGWIGDADEITDPSDLEIGPDGERLFVGGLSSGNAYIEVYHRVVATGVITSIGETTYAASTAAPVTAIEPDGSHVFGTSNDAIVSVDADTGYLSFDTEIPLLEDGIAGVSLAPILTGLTVSPDGHHAYASNNAGTISVFTVAAYDFLEAETDGVPTPGLVSVSSVAVSPDGENVYATGAGEDAIQVFTRDTTTGVLSGSQIVRDNVAGVTGLDGVRDVVVSPSGSRVYAASAADDAAVAFARDASGQLAFLNAETDGVGGVNGLAGAFALAISPDGKNVYVASDVDDALAIFGVVARTGELSPGGFFQDGVGGVNGLAIAQSVVVSPDGKHVYVGGRGDDAISFFTRDTVLGSLQFQAAVTGGGLGGVTDVAISPDGLFLYATGFDDDSLVRFQRNPATGVLSSRVQTAHVAGSVDGLDGPRSVEVSRDGRRLFVTGDVGSVLAIYRRNPDNGTLKLIQAETDQARTENALAGVRATAASRDGRTLYAAAPIDNAVVAFAPEPGAAALGIVALLAVRLYAAKGSQTRTSSS
jgi:6-phosphogluconolactonase (cycloisomerase 2 family)